MAQRWNRRCSLYKSQKDRLRLHQHLGTLQHGTFPKVPAIGLSAVANFPRVNSELVNCICRKRTASFLIKMRLPFPATDHLISRLHNSSAKGPSPLLDGRLPHCLFRSGEHDLHFAKKKSCFFQGTRQIRRCPAPQFTNTLLHHFFVGRPYKADPAASSPAVVRNHTFIQDPVASLR